MVASTCASVDRTNGGKRLPARLEVRRGNGDADAGDRRQREIRAERGADVTRAMVEGRDREASHGDRHCARPPPLDLLPPSGEREIERFERATPAHEAEQHDAAGSEGSCGECAQRFQTLHAIQRAEVRDDAVERLVLAQRVEKLREVLQPAGHHLGAIADAVVGETAQCLPHHRFGGIAGDHADAVPCQKGGVESGAAADLEHAESGLIPMEKRRVRAPPHQLEELAIGQRVVVRREPIERLHGGHDDTSRDMASEPPSDGIGSSGGATGRSDAVARPAARA